ncbi:MAG: hypothetical protein R3B93_01285 [Bacteroidia bacterium]
MQQYTWFYSLKSPLSPEQVAALEVDFAQFLSKWNTHGTPVDGLITLKYNRFIIIQSDPKVARPSGCSIDSLKRAIGEILNAHRLEVVDSAYIFYGMGMKRFKVRISARFPDSSMMELFAPRPSFLIIRWTRVTTFLNGNSHGKYLVESLFPHKTEAGVVTSGRKNISYFKWPVIFIGHFSFISISINH